MRAARLSLSGAMLLASCAHVEAPVPSSAVPTQLEVLGTGPRISMARIALGPGEELHLAASRCQDVSLLVEAGTVRAGVDGGYLLEQGQAIRLSASTTLRADTGKGAQLFAAAVLSESAAQETVDWNQAPENEACPLPSTARLASDPARIGPFTHAGGRLAVTIYLDGSGSARPAPSLCTLDGEPTLGVPEHTHEHSAEVLWFQNGSGTMRVGDESQPIRPGTFVYVPPKTIHGFEPDRGGSLFAYQVYTPAGPEQRFRNVGPRELNAPSAEGRGRAR